MILFNSYLEEEYDIQHSKNIFLFYNSLFKDIKILNEDLFLDFFLYTMYEVP